MTVNVSFLSEFELPLLSGRKTCATRYRKLGSRGDYFKAFGGLFVIEDIQRVYLYRVSRNYYHQEGFDSPGDFIACWKRTHPTRGYQPNSVVYLHKFGRVE